MRTTQNAAQLIYAPQPHKNNKLHITFSNQHLKDYLVLYGGHPRSVLKKNPRKVSIDVLLNGKRIKQLKWGSQFPMEVESIAMPKGATTPAELTFVINGANNKSRTFGFDGFWADKPAKGTL